MPAVSVIIPAYNSADFLPTAIQSVLEQTFKDFEIIVIDDGSTDNTKDVLTAFGSSVRYLHTPNSGPSAARNMGINKSSSKYVAFLDADDWWVPEKLKKQIEVLSANPDISFVCSDWFNGESGDEPRNSVLCEYDVWSKPANFDIMLQENFVNSSTVIADRDKLLKAGLFMESLRGAEDRHLWLRLLMTGNAYVCKEIMAFRRFHRGNTTMTLSFIESQVKMIDDVLTWPTVRADQSRLEAAQKRRFELLIGLAYRFSITRKYKEAAVVYGLLYSENFHRWQSGIRYLWFTLLGLLSSRTA